VIHVGIIGCGAHTESVHLPVLRRLEGVRVRAACDTQDERLRHVGRAFGISQLHRDAADLLANPELDAVLIATPGDTHAALADAAIAAKKHLLVEKPFALTVADAEVMAATARAATVTAMVGFNYRFHPLTRDLKAAIDAGRVGRPLAVFSTRLTGSGQRKSITGYESSPARGGGVFYDKAVHVIDLLRFLFDCEVATGRATARSEAHQHDFGTIEMVMANGVHAMGLFSDSAVPDATLLVIGDEGKASVNYARPMGVALYRREFSRSRAAKLWAYARQSPRLASAVRLATPAGRLSSYRIEWQHFFTCIESGTSPRPSFEDGLRVTRTLSQLIASLDGPSGCPGR
jgi:predicted dehydrogenase